LRLVPKESLRDAVSVAGGKLGDVSALSFGRSRRPAPRERTSRRGPGSLSMVRAGLPRPRHGVRCRSATAAAPCS